MRVWQSKTMMAKSANRTIEAILQQVACRVRAARVSRGISLESLSLLVGLKLQQLSRYETGRCKLNVHRLALIAAALNVPLSYFFEDFRSSGEEKPGKSQRGSGGQLALFSAYRELNPKARRFLLSTAKSLIEAPVRSNTSRDNFLASLDTAVTVVEQRVGVPLSRRRGRIERRLVEAINSIRRPMDTFELAAVAYDSQPDIDNRITVSQAQLVTVRRALRNLKKSGVIDDLGRRWGRQQWGSKEQSRAVSMPDAISARERYRSRRRLIRPSVGGGSLAAR
jgi:transcriptional regulator with XRE-family HTH domain